MRSGMTGRHVEWAPQLDALLFHTSVAVWPVNPKSGVDWCQLRWCRAFKMQMALPKPSAVSMWEVIFPSPVSSSCCAGCSRCNVQNELCMSMIFSMQLASHCLVSRHDQPVSYPGWHCWTDLRVCTAQARIQKAACLTSGGERQYHLQSMAPVLQPGSYGRLC